MFAQTQPAHNPSADKVQSAFLALLPRVETHARVHFRHVRCPIARGEKVAEAVALAWKWHCRLVERGKDASRFPAAFASLVARAVGSGRRVCGQERANDVMSPLAQRRHAFKVEELPITTRADFESLYSSVGGQRRQDVYEERLADNTVSPVPDQVQFRIDFPAWLVTLTPRERRLIGAMARDERTRDLADQFEVSPGRISQLRREFRDGWARFCGDGDAGVDEEPVLA